VAKYQLGPTKRRYCFREQPQDMLSKHFTVQLWTAGGFMEWTAPVFEEVCLNCEINSYASAKL
jgi:coenzyme PQQ precursor peptide PqqA